MTLPSLANPFPIRALFGDGMNIEHEITTSRYLYGKDFALSFHHPCYKANVATWDVSTYNQWAADLSKPAYDPSAIDPEVGYDPAKCGNISYQLKPELKGAGTYYKFAYTDSASTATAWATGYKTDDGYIAWLSGDLDRGAFKTIAELLRYFFGQSVRGGYSAGTPRRAVLEFRESMICTRLALDSWRAPKYRLRNSMIISPE